LKPVPGKEGYVSIPTGYQKEESVMKYITNAETRKHLQFQTDNPVNGNNTARVEELVQKRHEKALT
jgi:Zn-dependent oligopeptidase